MTGAHFNVHRNPARNPGRPLLLILQSNDFLKVRTRVVAPLVRGSTLMIQERDHPRMAPVISVDGADYTLNVLDLATVSVDKLGPPVANVP